MLLLFISILIFHECTRIRYSSTAQLIELIPYSSFQTTIDCRGAASLNRLLSLCPLPFVSPHPIRGASPPGSSLLACARSCARSQASRRRAHAVTCAERGAIPGRGRGPRAVSELARWDGGAGEGCFAFVYPGAGSEVRGWLMASGGDWWGHF